ncbi:hypothetical protein ABZ650_20340 [Streptomyces griseoviridis]|uniref:hypothetical protein n=1 Tax=Streptomyces griseoviridis TaxID=45398 RepID=UPI00340661B9
MTDRMPVDGPYRIYVDATPTGAGVDVSHYLTAVLLNLANAAEEDPVGVLESLVDLAAVARSAAHQGRDSHAAHERDERVERLLAEVADGGVLPVYGAQVARFAGRLSQIAAPRALPGQQDRRAS